MPVRLTETYLRSVIRQELKEMMGGIGPSAPNVDPEVDNKLYDFLDNAEVGERFPLSELAKMFDTTPEKVRMAFEHGGDDFRPYEYWCTLERDVIVKYDDSEAA